MKTLIIRFSSAGDIILTSLFVRVLRNRFPDGTIDFLTKKSFAPLVKSSPYVDRVISGKDDAGLSDALTLRGQLKQEEYDLVFDLHNSLRSRIVRFGLGKKRFSFQKPTFRKWLLVHFKINRLHPIIPIPERYLDIGSSISLKNDGKGLDIAFEQIKLPNEQSIAKPLIVLAPGARHYTKRWPATRYAAVGKGLLHDYGGTIVLLGSTEEIETCEKVANEIAMPEAVVNLGGKTTLAQAGTLIKDSSLVIANDSALGHVAAACGAPLISIFGSTVEEFGFAPYSPNARVIQNMGLRCRPCTSIGRSECPREHFECMKDVSIEAVLTVARQILKP